MLHQSLIKLSLPSGNLYTNPLAGLLFIDYARGDTLQLTGTATVQYHDTSQGGTKTVTFTPESWVHIVGGLPISVEGDTGLSPYNPVLPANPWENTSTDGDVATGGKSAITPIGEKVVVERTVLETHDVKTYYFRKPSLGFSYLSGQFASFDFPGLDPSDPSKTINRTWTISSPPQQIGSATPGGKQHKQGEHQHSGPQPASSGDAEDDHGTFSITVKSAGLVSSHLFNTLRKGDAMLFRGVDGDFTPQLLSRGISSESQSPNVASPSKVLLIAGGIGITPLRAMLPELLAQGHDVTLVYSVRNSWDAAFLPEFAAIAMANPQQFRVLVTVTATPGQENEHWVHSNPVVWCSGRVSAEMLGKAVPDVASRAVFLCGPGGFMEGVVGMLERLGVQPGRIFQEAFTF